MRPPLGNLFLEKEVGFRDDSFWFLVFEEKNLINLLIMKNLLGKFRSP